MCQKYKDKRTERFALGERVKEFQAFERQAYKRLEILESAPNKEALMTLPSNHFEALGGSRKGQYSICQEKKLKERLNLVCLSI